ncbi:MAG: hypothetical protein ACOC6Q_02020 [Patescibacteria group bacterium]
MKEKKVPLVLVRESDKRVAECLEMILRSAGCDVRLVEADMRWEEVGAVPDMVLTFWGTIWDGAEHPIYGAKSRVFCENCVRFGVPFVILTRVPETVENISGEIAEQAVAVLEKSVATNADIVSALGKALE